MVTFQPRPQHATTTHAVVAFCSQVSPQIAKTSIRPARMVLQRTRVVAVIAEDSVVDPEMCHAQNRVLVEITTPIIESAVTVRRLVCVTEVTVG